MAFFSIEPDTPTRNSRYPENSCYYPFTISHTDYKLAFSNKKDVLHKVFPSEQIWILHGAGEDFGGDQDNAEMLWKNICSKTYEKSLSVIGFYYSAIDQCLSIFYPDTAYQTIYVRKDQNYFHIGSLLRDVDSALVEDLRERYFLYTFQFLPHSLSGFSGVKRLSPGSVWTLRGQNLASECISPREKYFANVEEVEAVNHLYTTLKEVIAYQVKGYDKIAVMLGGFDSALIVSILHELGKPVKAFTFAYDDPQYQQSNLDFLSALSGLQHQWVRIDSETLRRGLANFPRNYSGPVSQPQYLIFTSYLAEVIRADGFDLCLTGDGCDGAFFGYPTVMKKAQLISHLRILPTFLTSGFRYLMSFPLIETLMGQPARLLRHVLSLLPRNDEIPPFMYGQLFDDISYKRLFNIDSVPDISDMINSVSAPFRHMEYYHQIYAGKNFVGLNKNKLAACQNQTGLMLKSPYMAPELKYISQSFTVEFWMGNHGKAAGSGGKYLLAQMAKKKNLLPEHVIFQKKQSPVCSPADTWMRETLKDLIWEIVEKSGMTVNKRYLASLFKEKLLEEIYKNRVTIDKFCMQHVAFLATYASFLISGDDNASD